MYTRIIVSDARARAKPCLRCGYSLRKIESLHCPECGLSAWVSLNGNDGLEGSNPQWLSRLSLGTAIMAVAQIFAAVALACHAFIPAHHRAFGLWYLMAAVGSGIYSSALLLVCLHENRYPDRVRIRRWVARAAGIMGLLVAPLLMWTGLSFMQHPNYLASLGLVAPVVGLFLAVPALCTWVYLQPLAKRGFHSRLSRLCGIMMFAPLLPAIKGFPFLFFIVGDVVALLGHLLPWIYIPASAAMLIWFSILFSRASKVASAHWATETAGA